MLGTVLGNSDLILLTKVFTLMRDKLKAEKYYSILIINKKYFHLMMLAFGLPLVSKLLERNDVHSFLQ